MTRTFETPGVSQCPCCRHELGMSTYVGGKRDHAPPKPGDLTVCLYCAALLQFNPALGVVRLSAVPSDADDATRELLERTRSTILAMWKKSN